MKKLLNIPNEQTFNNKPLDLDKKQLETIVNNLLKNRNQQISLQRMLTGGVISDVYQAELTENNGNRRHIVVKYTKKQMKKGLNFSSIDTEYSFFDTQAVHNLDVQIQRYLSENTSLKTPTIIQHFAKESVTLMENFTVDNFVLLQKRLLENDLSWQTAQRLGQSLAIVQKAFKLAPKNLSPIENSRHQFNERFFELKALLYNGRMDIFNQIEKTFLESNPQLTWTDGDQKNFAINKDGEIILFDLGRSIVADSDFMLPNLIGHLGLFYLADYEPTELSFLEEIIKSFMEEKTIQNNLTYQLNEEKFVNYFMASLLHRGLAMRWIDSRIADKIGEDSLKYASMHLGDIVFDKNNRVITIKELFYYLREIATLAKKGKYQRPTIK